ncbi:hypothetical protein ACJX0J_021831, partial [Zea mays]
WLTSGVQTWMRIYCNYTYNICNYTYNMLAQIYHLKQRITEVKRNGKISKPFLHNNAFVVYGNIFYGQYYIDTLLYRYNFLALAIALETILLNDLEVASKE